MPDVAQEAMEALLVLHHPEKIEVRTEPFLRLLSDRSCIDVCFSVGVEPRGADQHVLGRQLAGPILHIAEADPASDHELHGNPEVAPADPDLPQRVPLPAQGVREPRESDRDLQTGAHKAGGRLFHVPVEHRYGRRAGGDELFRAAVPGSGDSVRVGRGYRYVPRPELPHLSRTGVGVDGFDDR